MHPILLLEVYVGLQPFIKLQVKTVPWGTVLVFAVDKADERWGLAGDVMTKFGKWLSLRSVLRHMVL